MTRRGFTAPSLHMLHRIQERQIDRSVVEFVISNGSKIRVPGGGFAWILKRKDIPPWAPPNFISKAKGVVAVTIGPTIVTTYRDHNFLKKNERK